MDLTVVVLTKNEEKNIAEVISNAGQVTENILIVDAGSADATVELAKANGAKVVFRAWDDDFAAQRNFALEHVKTRWVLYLDADERLDAKLVKAVRDAVSKNEQKQYSMLRKSHACGFTHKHGIFKPDEVLRLFIADEVYWQNKVHERPICSLPQEKLKGYIDHYTYDSWQNWWDKAGKYTSIWAEDQYAKGKRAGLSGAFFHAFYGFIRAYIIQLGFLDGWGGLYSSIQHFVYTMMKYLKLWEMGKGK